MAVASCGKFVICNEAPAFWSKRKTPPTSQTIHQTQGDKRKKVTTSVGQSASEVAASGTYFGLLLDGLDGVLGYSTRALDKKEVSGDAFCDYITRHNLLVRFFA